MTHTRMKIILKPIAWWRQRFRHEKLESSRKWSTPVNQQ